MRPLAARPLGVAVALAVTLAGVYAAATTGANRIAATFDGVESARHARLARFEAAARRASADYRAAREKCDLARRASRHRCHVEARADERRAVLRDTLQAGSTEPAGGTMAAR